MWQKQNIEKGRSEPVYDVGHALRCPGIDRHDGSAIGDARFGRQPTLQPVTLNLPTDPSIPLREDFNGANADLLRSVA